jgi:hypothetical protein
METVEIFLCGLGLGYVIGVLIIILTQDTETK